MSRCGMPGCSAEAELCQRCADIPSAQVRDELAKYRRAVTRKLHRDMDAVLHAHDADTYENRLHAENEARMAECATLHADLAAAQDRVAALERALSVYASASHEMTTRARFRLSVPLDALDTARAALDPTSDTKSACERNPTSSRTCERGTRCCTVRHGKTVKP